MMNRIEIKIYDYNLLYIEGVRKYSTICNTPLMDETWTADQIINWCIEWIYESFANILNQIIVIPVPLGEVSCEILKKLLEQMKAVKINEAVFDEKKAGNKVEFFQKILQQNVIRLTKAIEQKEKGISSRTAEEPQHYIGESKEIELSVEIREEIRWKWEWLKDMLARQHRQAMSWGELIQYCLVGTYMMLKSLQGGFQLRIPLYIIGVEGAEHLEEQFDKWIAESSENGAHEQELAVLKQGKDAIHQEVWQAVKMKLSEENRKYCIIIKQ